MAAKKLDGIETIKISSKHVILISDIHFGVYVNSVEWQDNISDYFYNWFFPYVKNMLTRYPDVVLCCLGDVYEDRSSIDIDVNNLCIDVFEQLARIIPCYIINGNHDLSKKTNKGNSSLRSLSNITNLTLIREPKLLQFVDGRKNVAKIAAIPYLGDCNEENKMLVTFSGNAEYAFMHTDISKMKFDNGMTIEGAVDADKFSGRVISGHIHKRQETKKVVYVGNPFHTKRSDIGNQKGIYMLDLETGEMKFTENKYSPIFDRIEVSKFMTFTDEERTAAVKDNYIDIIADEESMQMYKKYDVQQLLDQACPKRSQIQETRKKTKVDVDGKEVDEDYVEKNLEELISNAIDSLEDIKDEDKAVLKQMSSDYLKNAQSLINEA